MNKYKLITYTTLTGTKSVLEILKRKSCQWIIYQNDTPTYFVDCFDFKSNSNLKMNNLILSERKSINDVIRKICKTHQVKLSLPKKPLCVFKSSSEIQTLALKPLPEEWL